MTSDHHGVSAWRGERADDRPRPFHRLSLSAVYLVKKLAAHSRYPTMTRARQFARVIRAQAPMNTNFA
jgi:hypothetical protein